MSEELVKLVQDQLNEEKWTRAAISNYSKNNFIELAATVAKAHEENCIDEIKEICDEHLSHTKNSVIALYLSGMLGLKKKALDNSALITLIDLFTDNHKNDIVTYLCESILDEDENNKFALHTLADCYREKNVDKVWEIYETIVRVDHDEADIVKLLAEKYEKDGDTETAIDYYKMALVRYVNAKSSNQVQEMWKKLISLIPEEIDFFLMVQRKVSKTINAEKSALLMQDLYVYYKKEQKWDTAIDILKLILSIDEKDGQARREIVECYREKFAGHSQLDDYIRVSNLSQSWRNVFEAIADFEKHIAFDKGNFVFHRSWGVGRIIAVTNDSITINFGAQKGKKDMALKMAISALTPLKKDHIWVIKATNKKPDLVKRVKDDPLWTLQTVIKSFDNCCDFKRIKAELVPSILTPSEWTSWSTKARKILESNPSFGISPNDINMYVVRDHEITPEEKLANEFKAQKNFFARIDIIMRLAELDSESDSFIEMFNYFDGYIKAFTQVTEQTLAAYLTVRSIVQKNSNLDPEFKPEMFGEIFSHIENPNELYLSLKDTKNTSLRKDFLTCIRMLPDWADVYIRLFPTVLQEEMLTTLINNGFEDKLKKLVATAFENYRDFRAATVWFFGKSQDEEWFKAVNIPYEKQMITLIHIMDICYKEIANHCDTTENKKILHNIEQLLFKDDTMLKYMLDHDEETITRLYTLVDDLSDFDPAIKMTMRNRILEKMPKFKFPGSEEKAVTPRGLIVTSKMLAIKKDLLENLIKVEVPKNSKEIGDAIAMGDLSENAEYKAARERQTQLNAQITRLQDEIDRAVVFDPTTVTTARVSFGTKVTLLNTNTNKDEVFTILGPWESDPENFIISYMSPLGNAILNSKVNDKLKFEINEHDYAYEVKEIAVAAL
ncbi:MAG: transcription elongation factor GreA [Treponema sp.]|nr:transcription elongation factor GreA [Candidatus Treponema caballi]